ASITSSTRPMWCVWWCCGGDATNSVSLVCRERFLGGGGGFRTKRGGGGRRNRPPGWGGGGGLLYISPSPFFVLESVWQELHLSSAIAFAIGASTIVPSSLEAASPCGSTNRR